MYICNNGIVIFGCNNSIHGFFNAYHVDSGYKYGPKQQEEAK